MKTKNECLKNNGIDLEKDFSVGTYTKIRFAMQEYSDQQTVNLKAINEKQAELFKRIYNRHGFLSRDLPLLKEIEQLQSGTEPSAVEMVREAFEPIQRREEEPKHPTSWRDFTMTDGEEHSDSNSPDYDSINVKIPESKTTHKGVLQPLTDKETSWEADFIEWDNVGHSNASQRDIINWFKDQIQPIEPQEPKCEECPSKQFYEANTAKIMDKIEQPEISVTDEEIDTYYPNEAPPMAFNSKYANFFKVEGATAMRDGKIKSNG